MPVLGIGQRVVSDSSSSNLRRNCRLHRRGATPLAVAHFEPSQETKDRVADLIHREKTTSLGPDETLELDYCLRVGRRYRRPYGLRSPVVMSLPGRYTAFMSGVLRAVAMKLELDRYWLITWCTYGSWLPGDPRWIGYTGHPQHSGHTV